MSPYRRATNLRASMTGLAAFAVITLTPGCTRARTAPAPASNASVITQEQIEPLHASNAYDVVEALRPSFLHSRGRESSDPRVPPIPVRVYVDDTSYGDASSLKRIRVSDIEEIRFYQSYEAQYKFGTGNPGGVIQIITKM